MSLPTLLYFTICNLAQFKEVFNNFKLKELLSSLRFENFTICI